LVEILDPKLPGHVLSARRIRDVPAVGRDRQIGSLPDEDKVGYGRWRGVGKLPQRKFRRRFKEVKEGERDDCERNGGRDGPGENPLPSRL
jgi:hypothetical protein